MIHTAPQVHSSINTVSVLQQNRAPPVSVENSIPSLQMFRGLRTSFILPSVKPVFPARTHTSGFTCRVDCSMKHHSGAAERNKRPILAVLQRVLPNSGRLLEVASGTGQHVATFAAAMPGWQFHPTDLDKGSRASVDAYVTEAKLKNVSPAVKLDATSWPWPVTEADAIFASNMVHISPWNSTVGLLEGASKVLTEGGTLVLYGPYIIDGKTANSNLRFSESLKQRNPEWGVRELRTLQSHAEAHGLSLAEIVPMPANNHCIVFRKREASS